MVRCCKCKKSFKEHTGQSWNDGMCHRCWLKMDTDLNYNIPKLVIRLMSNPVDFYLDLYTLREMDNMKTKDKGLS